MTTKGTNDKGPELLLEEYKIIQAKIDKLGEDKFKVRSWCFTVLTGGLTAIALSGALRGPWYTPCILLLAIPAIVAFNLVEKRQRQIGRRLGTRAAMIELHWSRAARAAGTISGMTPRVARELIREENFRSGTLIAKADDAFYWTQYALMVLLVGSLVIYRFRTGTSNNFANPTTLIQINTNEFRVFTDRTNVFTTNFVQVLAYTTNFQIITKPTTNYLPANFGIQTTNR